MEEKSFLSPRQKLAGVLTRTTLSARRVTNQTAMRHENIVEHTAPLMEAARFSMELFLIFRAEIHAQSST